MNYDVTQCLVLCVLVSGGSVAQGGVERPRGGLARTRQLLPAPCVLGAPCFQRTPLANILYMVSFSSASKSESCVVVGASYSCDNVQW